jgi:hypothetical protein
MFTTEMQYEFRIRVCDIGHSGTYTMHLETMTFEDVVISLTFFFICHEYCRAEYKVLISGGETGDNWF